MNDTSPNTPKRERALNFHISLGNNPKTGRQKKAHARTVAIATKPTLLDAQEAKHLSKPQQKRLRVKRGRELRKKTGE
jgi:hypothetical protein